MSLLKKFSKSTQDLREKKKWRISTLKPRKKEHVRSWGGGGDGAAPCARHFAANMDRTRQKL